MADTDPQSSLIHAPNEQVITLEQAAEMLLIENSNPRNSVRRLVRAKKLHALRNGRALVTTVGAVREYIRHTLRLDTPT